MNILGDLGDLRLNFLFYFELSISLVAQTVKNPSTSAGDTGLGFDPWVRNIPWRKEWFPTPVFLPAEFHGQRSLVGSSPWGLKRVRPN